MPIQNGTGATLGRRDYIKSAAGLGLTIAGVSTVVNADSGADDEVRYIRSYEFTDNGEREPQYGSVPREKWVRRKAAENASQRLSSIVRPRFTDGVVQVGENYNNGEASIIVSIDRSVLTQGGQGPGAGPIDESVIEERIPSTQVGRSRIDGSEYEQEFNIEYNINDMHTDSRSSSSFIDCSSDYYVEKYRPVPAGCNFTLGTITCRGYKNGEEVLLTSGHGLNGFNGDLTQPNYNCDQVTTKYVVSPEETEGFGGTVDIPRPHKENVDEDYGYFYPQYLGTNWADTTNRFAAKGGGYKSYPIEGVMTWNWVQMQAGQPRDQRDDLSKQGEQTEVTSGPIEILYNGNGQKKIFCDYYSDSGDSGAPIYYMDTASVDIKRKLVGLHANRYYEEDPSVQKWVGGGNHISKIENDFGLTVA